MGFPVCPDPGPHQRGGGPGLTSLPTNAVAPLQDRCWLHAAAWPWGAALWPQSWGGGEMMFMTWALLCAACPGQVLAGLSPRAGGQRLALGVCPSSPACTFEGVGEAPSRLVLYPECHVSLQIPRVDGEYDLKMPRDMAYVFSGAYIPLSCKIIEQVSPPAAGEHRACPPKPGFLPGGPAGVSPPRAGSLSAGWSAGLSVAWPHGG